MSASSARDATSALWMIVDWQLLTIVTSVCRSAYVLSRVRQIRHILRSLSEEATKMLVLAFIFSRLDYCNAASSTICINDCSQYIMQQPGWQCEQVSMKTAPLFWATRLVSDWHEMATRPTPRSRIQTHHAHVQDTEWSSTAISVRWLPCSSAWRRRLRSSAVLCHGPKLARIVHCWRSVYVEYIASFVTFGGQLHAFRQRLKAYLFN